MASALKIVKGKLGGPMAAGAALLALLVAPGAAGAQGRPGEDFDYAAYARVLETYVPPEGRVRYAALKQNPGDLNAFIQQLAAVSPENRPELFPTPAAQMAYWINAYNAFVLHTVVEAYPVESVRDLKFGFGLLFFKRDRLVAGGRRVSLDDIEHGILRRQFADPRIHFAINCASASCPPLARPTGPRPWRRSSTRPPAPSSAGRKTSGCAATCCFSRRSSNGMRRTSPAGPGRRTAPFLPAVDYLLRYLPAETAARIRQEKPR